MSGRIYDLSMPFTRDMPTYFFWKNWHHPPFFATFTDLEETSLGPGTGEGFVSLVAFLTHTGTHMDARGTFDAARGICMKSRPIASWVKGRSFQGPRARVREDPDRIWKGPGW